MSAGHGTPNQIKFILGLIVLGFIFTIFPVNLYRDLPYINTVDLKSKQSDRTDYYKVSRVVDGDTLEIIYTGTNNSNAGANASSNTEYKKVRLIGINTPETVDPRRTVQCYGKEASKYMKDIAEGEYVQLEYDATQAKTDKYGRLLAYAYLQNGEMLNEKMIADGYAYQYTYDTPYKYSKRLKNAESLAKYAGRGLWSSDTCNGKL